LTKLEKLPTLEEVYLDNVQFDDPVLAMQLVGKVKTLKRLTLRNTNVNDASLAGLTRLSNLEILELDETKIGDEELRDRFRAITEEIKERREVLSPRTAEGRDLHSLRAAMRVELAQRGIDP
jgi:hypothetical protein